MRKEDAISLRKEALIVSMIYSARKGFKEQFGVLKIHPTGDNAAIVIYKKNTGKLALCFFYKFDNGIISHKWKYLFPTDSMIMGMSMIPYFKAQIESTNLNFNKE